MKLINLTCANCGAELQVDAEGKQAYCSYCGKKLFIDDENVTITSRIVDEARLKEAEIRLRELEYEHEREIREETIRKEQKRSYIISVLVVLAALGIAYSIESLRHLFVLFLILGCIVLVYTRKGDQTIRGRSRRYVCSPKSRLAALLMCVFLGPLGVHQFYVGKVGMGILYLFTLGFFGIGWLIDIIRIACGIFRDRYGLYLQEW